MNRIKLYYILYRMSFSQLTDFWHIKNKILNSLRWICLQFKFVATTAMSEPPSQFYIHSYQDQYHVRPSLAVFVSLFFLVFFLFSTANKWMFIGLAARVGCWIQPFSHFLYGHSIWPVRFNAYNEVSIFLSRQTVIHTGIILYFFFHNQLFSELFNVNVWHCGIKMASNYVMLKVSTWNELSSSKTLLIFA